MAYSVVFYTVSKKLNSTAQPAGVGTSISCKLKDRSSIINPTIVVDFSTVTGATPKAYNMVYISEFSRYYWIEDVSFVFGVWEYRLSVDVLASWKTNIGASTLYVTRSSSNYDTSIVDSFYPIKTGVTFSATSQASNPFATAFGNGYFVVGVINADTSAVGAVSYYVFTNAEFRAFAAYLLGTTSYWGTVEISDQLLKCLYNPFQYVVSCTWVPVSPPTSGSINTIKVGWWDIPATCSRLSATVRTAGTATITIPVHPDGATRTFLKGEPFSSYYLEFPPFGAFSIPASYLVNAAYVDFAWSVDCITGEGKLSIGADNAAQPFNIVHGQIGVPIQLAQMAPDVAGSIQSITPSTKFDWLNESLSMVSNIASAIITSYLPMQSTGGNGGFSAGYYPIKLTGTFAYLADEDVTEFGRPSCKNLTINTLTGYVQCLHGDIQIPCTKSELAEIRTFLETGFFYE